MSKRLTTQEFILKSTSKHGNRYDYSNTEYVSEKSLISINCLEHGIFYQLPSVHYSKKTIEREECLKSLGYKIVSIWESDFKKINNRLCQ